MKPVAATSSLAASDPETDSLGVAVQSKFLAVGAVVPWARGCVDREVLGSMRGKG